MKTSHLERNSGVDLLRILALILIVISHVTQTWGGGIVNSHFSTEYLIDFQNASTNIQYTMLAWFRSFGCQGNLIFFTCSAWFLLERDRVDPGKVVAIIADVCCINVLIQLVLRVCGLSIAAGDAMKSLFPTMYALNWFVTCYILVYLFHPYLNLIAKKCSKAELFAMDFILSAIYFGICFINPDLFFSNDLILFLVLYLDTAYLKFHMPEFCSSRKKNLILAVAGILGNLGLALLMNFLGNRVAFLNDKLLCFAKNSSPFLLMTAFGAFNLFYHADISHPAISRVSSASLLIYVLHEALLIREYIRPILHIWVYRTFGYAHIVLWVLAISAGLFTAALCLTLLYQALMQRFVHRAFHALYARLSIPFRKMADWFTSIQ